MGILIWIKILLGVKKSKIFNLEENIFDRLKSEKIKLKERIKNFDSYFDVQLLSGFLYY